jgi:hypothetical protein
VSQLSFFSADSVPPAVSDSPGCSPRPAVVGRRGAAAVGGRRRAWRAQALAEMIAETG